MKNPQLEIAKLIGQPINPHLPVPVELGEIADVFTAEVGEKVWRYTAFDTSDDICYQVDPNGAITLVKRTPTGDAELTFDGLNSKMEYVLIDDILSETDNVQVLGRRKESITRSMDKRELWTILGALLSKTAGYLPGVEPHDISVGGTGEPQDLYDAIMAMKHAVEDYGDNFVLLVGSTVKEKIDLYDKDNAGTFNYNVTLPAKLRELGITVMKVFGVVDVGNTGGEEVIMDTNSMILVARNSRISEGKPIKFVRRKISADIARLMGAEVDSAQRAIVVNPTPVNNAGTNTLAYGVYGYESVIFTITNPKAIAICDAETVL
jgi:hypothetical protein